MATNTFSGTGVWSDGTKWSLGRAPTIANADKVVIAAAAACTLDGAYSAGDDTTTATTVNGTLKWSRSVTSSLTVRGTLVGAATGAVDMGTESDPIPSGVTASLILNDSATQATNKYTGTLTGGFSAWGVDKTLDTYVQSFTSNTTFRVPDATNWAVGDWLYFCQSQGTAGTPDSDVREVQSITPVSGVFEIVLTAAVSASAMFVNRRVANLTRNVKVYGLNNQTYGTALLAQAGATAANNAIEVGPCEVRGAGSSTTSPTLLSALALSATTTAQVKAIKKFVIHNVSSVSGATTTVCAAGQFGAYGLLTLSGGAANLSTVDDFVLAMHGRSQASVTEGGLTTCTGESRVINNPRIFGCPMPIRSSTGAFSLTVNNPLIIGGASLVAGGALSEATIVGGKYAGWSTFLTSSAVALENYSTLAVSQLDLSPTNYPAPLAAGVSSFVQLAANAFLKSSLFGCNLPAGYAVSRTANSSSLSGLSVSGVLKFLSNGGAAADNWLLVRGGRVDRDNSVSKHGASSVRFDCWYSANPLTYSFTVKVAAGQTINLRGSTRYNSTYGTSTPPQVTISGLGITSVTFTDPATGADTWHDYSLTATNSNSYPGEFTVTYTGQSAANSAGAYCYFDGVLDSPWVDTAREFGYLYADTAYRTADSSITVSEATALAYPVSFNHSTQAATVTGNLTARQFYEAFKASLAQTANMGVTNTQANARISTGDGGASFVTTYSISIDTGCVLTGNFTTTGAVSGAGTVDGVYTSTAGTSTRLTLTGLSGAVVEIFDSSSAHYAYSASVTGTYVLNLPPSATGTWTWKTAKYGFVSTSASFIAGGGTVAAAPVMAADVGITQAVAATVAAYTSLDTPDKQYDYLAYYQTTSTGILQARLAAKTGVTIDFGTKKLIYDATAGALVAWDSGTSTLTLKASAVVPGSTMTEVIATGAALSLLHGATQNLVYTDSAGRHVKILAPNLISGTRVQLYNVTDSAELYNGTLSGAGLTFPIVWTADKTIRLRAIQAGASTAKLGLESTGVLTSSGLSFLDNQVNDPVYAANGIDGSTVTEFTADYPNVQVDISDGDGETTLQRLYAWAIYNLTTSAGVAAYFGGITAESAVSYVVNVVTANLKFDNAGSTDVTIRGGYIRRSDGSSILAATMSGGHPISFDPGLPVTAAGAQLSPTQISAAVRAELAVELARIDATVTSRLASAGYTAPDNAGIAAVKARTDLLPDAPADNVLLTQVKKVVEADMSFIPGTPDGTGVLHYFERGTTTDLIPAKNVAGTSQTQPSEIAE